MAHLRVSYNIDVGLPRHGVPYSIPRDQAYYWSGDWQADIRASHAELVSGDYVEFDSDDPTDIIRWFLSDR